MVVVVSVVAGLVWLWRRMMSVWKVTLALLVCGESLRTPRPG